MILTREYLPTLVMTLTVDTQINTYAHKYNGSTLLLLRLFNLNTNRRIPLSSQKIQYVIQHYKDTRSIPLNVLVTPVVFTSS